MISDFESLILGVLQGLTEFIPVSSSAHLVIAQKLFGISESSLFFDVMLHIGTLSATILVFRKQVWQLLKAFPRLPAFCKNWFSKGHLAMGDDQHAWLLILILTTTFITGSIGVAFHDYFERTFTSLYVTGITLIITGILLFTSNRFQTKKGKTAARTTLKDALIMGLAQGLSILPGLSRSGTTISTGLFLGFTREFAGEYSFLVSLPVIFGATILELTKVTDVNIPPSTILIGVASSFILGWVSLKLLLGWIKKGKLTYFAYYVWALSLFSFYLAFRG